MSTEANAQIISVVGGCRRAGRWLVPSKTKVMTFFGRATIDLREAETTAEELSFDCMSAFASITFIVPEGAEIRPSGMAVLASARSDVPVEIGGSHLPKIAIDAITLLGRFRIITGEAFEAEKKDKAGEVAAGADLADTPDADVPVAAFVPPTEPAPYVPASDPAPFVPPTATDPPAQRTHDDGERSPIHDVTVPDSPIAVSLDQRPGPLPDQEPEDNANDEEVADNADDAEVADHADDAEVADNVNDAEAADDAEEAESEDVPV